MRAVLVALSFVCAATGVSAATPNERWVAPGGAFSLDLAGAGWRFVERDERPEWYEEDRLLVATPTGQGTGDDICTVEVHGRQTVLTRPTREGLNQLASGRRELLEAELRADERNSNVQVTTSQVDGVTTLDEQMTFMQLENTGRRFFIAEDRTLTLYMLTCMVRADNAEAIRTSRALAASLRFQ